MQRGHETAPKVAPLLMGSGWTDHLMPTRNLLTPQWQSAPISLKIPGFPTIHQCGNGYGATVGSDLQSLFDFKIKIPVGTYYSK